MMNVALGFVAGLLIGWNVLPQPQWVIDIIDRIRDR